MKTLAKTIACLALLTVATAGAWADATPPQVTLSSSTTHIPLPNVTTFVNFADKGGTLSFSFSGTVAQCGHSGCLAGNAFLEPQATYGRYSMWIAGGSSTLTVDPQDSSRYDVNLGSATIYMEVKLGPKGDGSLGDLVTTLDLEYLYGPTNPYPTFGGTFNATTSTMSFRPDFAPSPGGTIDFTVNLQGGPTIGSLTNNHQTHGFLSSGEVDAPVPEPSSLALIGTGVLGLAGIIRRKMKV